MNAPESAESQFETQPHGSTQGTTTMATEINQTLTRAAEGGDVAAVQLLLTRGRDATKNNQKYTIIYVARDYPRWQAHEILSELHSLEDFALRTWRKSYPPPRCCCTYDDTKKEPVECIQHVDRGHLICIGTAHRFHGPGANQYSATIELRIGTNCEIDGINMSQIYLGPTEETAKFFERKGAERAVIECTRAQARINGSKHYYHQKCFVNQFEGPLTWELERRLEGTGFISLEAAAREPEDQIREAASSYLLNDLVEIVLDYAVHRFKLAPPTDDEP